MPLRLHESWFKCNPCRLKCCHTPQSALRLGVARSEASGAAEPACAKLPVLRAPMIPRDTPNLRPDSLINAVSAAGKLASARD